MSQLNDISLVAQVVVFRNTRAFDQLVQKYQSPVRRFFLNLTCGDSELSDDLAQDTFIKAYTNIANFKNLSSFSTWLYRIAYNVFYDYIRSRKETTDLDARTYAPVVKKLLDALRPEIHGMVHCSGGAQTKVLHFVGDVRVVKDNLFPVPPLFRTIQEQSGTDWAEMYKVFNMGHRLEVYLSPEHAAEVIAISESFGIPAQIVGRIEESDKKELIIKSEFGEFRY